MPWVRLTTIAGLLLLAACGGGGGGGDRSSSNANLSTLRLDDGVLNPAFAAAITSYTADVGGGTTQTRVTAITASTRASLTIDGNAATSGTPSVPIDLVVGDTDIDVVVTAANGNRRTYRIRVTRPQPGNDASLADLALTAGPLVQVFDPNLTDYDADVGHLATSTRVIAEPSDPNVDRIVVDGERVAPGEPSQAMDLAVGANAPIDVQVVAEDDVTTRTYSVTTSRAPFATLAQRATVKASNTDAGDRFGSAVALAGDRLLVGAPNEQSSATGVDGNAADDDRDQAGAAYLYERTGGVWTAAHYLKASNTDEFDRFGWHVAASRDVLAVSAPFEQSLDGTQGDNSGTGVGAVYLFDPDAPGGPAQIGYLKADNADDNDRFGTSLAVDGERLLVGAESEQSSATGVNGNADDNSLTNAGAAYLFEPDGSGSWSQTAYLKASNTDSGQLFGSAVAFSDGRILIGARLEDSGATGVNGDQSDTSAADAGAAYLFEAANGTWQQVAYLKATNTEANDEFGFAVALDEDTAVIGAPAEDSASALDQSNNALPSSGAVYVFRRGIDGTWSQEAYLKAATIGQNDLFGSSLALVGNLLAVGAPGEASDATGINGDDTNEAAVASGAVYLFERDTTGSWNQIAYVKASNTDPADLFGFALALDGDTLAAGARDEASNATGIDGNENDNSAVNQPAGVGAGAVYVFR